MNEDGVFGGFPDLTCLKSATKVMSVPSDCRYSNVMESLSLSASSSSSAIWPSESRTLTFSSEHKPALSTEAQRNKMTPNERANIPKRGENAHSNRKAHRDEPQNRLRVKRR
ncbi:uncharacterized [Tachysurus ichikawai]